MLATLKQDAIIAESWEEVMILSRKAGVVAQADVVTPERRRQVYELAKQSAIEKQDWTLCASIQARINTLEEGSPIKSRRELERERDEKIAALKREQKMAIQVQDWERCQAITGEINEIKSAPLGSYDKVPPKMGELLRQIKGSKTSMSSQQASQPRRKDKGSRVDVEAASAQNVLIYKTSMNSVLSDASSKGVEVTDTERELLEQKAAKLNISEETHKRLLEEAGWSEEKFDCVNWETTMDIRQWTVSMTLQWIESIGKSKQCATIFKENKVDGTTLLETIATPE